MPLDHQLRFLKGYFRDPTTVGAVAPSSLALARALCEPFRQRSGSAKVLEVGAGTGAITRQIGKLLGDEDELDVCELVPEFADVLERDVLTQPDLASGVRSGRVRLLRQRVQEIRQERHYDYVISGLPLTSFELEDVRDVFDAFRRCLKTDGVLSYFEYVGLRQTSRTFALGRQRARIRSVSALLTEYIREHEFERQTVLRNIPPAYARHLRFGDAIRMREREAVCVGQ